MALKSQDNLWKHIIDIAVFVFLLFPGLMLNSGLAKAETISYPAEVTGCRVTLFAGKTRPTCEESLQAVLGYPVLSCSPNTISEFQNISCEYYDTTSGNNRTIGVDAYPIYTCPKGGKHYSWSSYATIDTYSFTPFTCDINLNNSYLISAKNLGGDDNCENSVYDGNPIHSGTGNKYEIAVDYISPTLEFTRYYNSNQNKSNSSIGIAWRHTYSARLTFDQSGTPTVVFAERKNGRIIFFSLVNGLWEGNDDVSARLLKLPNGNFQLITDSDIIETYDSDGNLLSIADRDDRIQTLTYDTSNRLVTVLDDIGRELNFTYDNSNRIATLTDPAVNTK